MNNYSSVNQNSVLTSDVSDEFFASVDSRRISTIGRASIIGVVGIIIMYLAIGSLFALEQPPFVGADEKAHLGYAHVVADGSLPTIDQLQPVPVWARQWMGEWVSTTPFANRSIWVANHPPLYYASVAPLIWFSELTHRPDGGLLLMRFANIAWGAVGRRVHLRDRERAHEVTADRARVDRCRRDGHPAVCVAVARDERWDDVRGGCCGHLGGSAMSAAWIDVAQPVAPRGDDCGRNWHTGGDDARSVRRRGHGRRIRVREARRGER